MQEQRYRAKYQQSLDLYGVVLEDQTQQPVVGATVALSPIDHPGMGSQQSATTTVYTDAQGRFSFVGHRGAHLNVDVCKPGYYTLRDGSSAMFTHDGADPTMHRQSFAPDPAAPARLYLRAQGTSARLVYYQLSQRVPRDGSPGEIQLASGNEAYVGHGDLRVECWGNDDGIRGGTPFDWWCRVSVPGGGLQARTGEFDFQAPESGYQLGEEVNMPAALGKERWQNDIRRDYFVHLANGNYARLNLEVHPGGHHLFYLTYYYNPAPGDRNLEGKASTQYRDYR